MCYDLGHSIKSSLCLYSLAGVQVLRIESFYGSLLCGYYSLSPRCQGRDFMAIFYYATVGSLLFLTAPSLPLVFPKALQAIGLFGLRLNRFPAAMGALLFFLLWDHLFYRRFNFPSTSLSQRIDHDDPPQDELGTKYVYLSHSRTRLLMYLSILVMINFFVFHSCRCLRVHKSDWRHWTLDCKSSSTFIICGKTCVAYRFDKCFRW